MAKGKTSNFTGLLTGLSNLEEGNTTKTYINEAENQAKEAEQYKEDTLSRTAHEEPGPNKENVDVSFHFHIDAKTRERLTVRKSFLISESNNRKLEAMAKAAGISQNELFNKLLDQM